MATAKTTEEKAEQHFLEVLKSFDRAMLVTHGSQAGLGTPASLHARPMAIAEVDPDGGIWFISGGDTSKVNELQEDSTILAVMQSGTRFMSVGGRAQLTRDRAKIHELWKETFRAWFDGKDDPNIVLIRLNPTEAEYWDSSGWKGLKFAMKVAAAVVSGKNMRREEQNADVSEHAKLNL